MSVAFNVEALPAFLIHQPGDTSKTKTAAATSASHQE